MGRIRVVIADDSRLARDLLRAIFEAEPGMEVVGEASNFAGNLDWLRESGSRIVLLNDPECIALMAGFIAAQPALWNEDIGED